MDNIVMNIIIFICIVLILPIPGYLLARWIKPLRPFYCKVLPWHDNEGHEFIEHDSLSYHCKCKWCGYEGMIDSQGNLF